MPLAVLPGTEGAAISGCSVAVRFTFLVTGGWASLATLHGTVYHSGGSCSPIRPLASRSRSATFVISVHQGVHEYAG